MSVDCAPIPTSPPGDKSVHSAGRETAAAHQRYQATRFFQNLNGLRCASIVAVVWHHVGTTWPWLPGSSRGFLGVDMFFVLSGFLIATLLLRERAATGTISLRKFYLRRSLRIFPPYYLVLVALALLSFLPGKETFRRDYWPRLPYYATYTSNWIGSHATNMEITWSLATEEQFYLVWPAVQRFLPPPAALTTLGGILAVNQVVNFGLLDQPIHDWLGMPVEQLSILQATFTPICLGVLLAWLLDTRWSFSIAYHMLGSRAAWCLASLLVLLLCQIPMDLRGSLRLAIQLGFTVMVAAAVVREDGWGTRLLRKPLVARLGEISYGVYLYHLWVAGVSNGLLRRAGGDQWLLRFFVCLLATYLVAELSFRLIERPFLRWKQGFSSG